MSNKPKVLKILIVGDGGVGKTTLLHRYIDGQFLLDTKMTIGVEFHLKELEVNEEKIYLQVWDLGGQEQFRFLHTHYAKGAKGALVLFDLTRPLTLMGIDEWVKICRDEDYELPMVFLGSKADLNDLINIDEEYIKEVQEKYEFDDYIRISSKTGENVNLAFQLLAQKIINRL
jgi:Ras-related protein Rab-11A